MGENTTAALFIVVITLAGIVVAATLTNEPTCTYEVIIEGIKRVVPCR